MRDATHLGTCPSVNLYGAVLVYLLRLAATGFASENILEVMSGDKQGDGIALRVPIDRLKVVVKLGVIQRKLTTSKYSMDIERVV